MTDSTWDHPAKVAAYLEPIDRLAPRAAGELVLAELIPPQPRRILDLGAGDGRLAALIASTRPSVTEIVVVDRSPAMVDLARRRFANDERAVICEQDLVDGITHLGRFDVIVSGFAIHHLEDDRKCTLIAEAASLLNDLGLFANLDVVASPPKLHASFLDAIGRDADDPEDRLCDVSESLTSMRGAGLHDVDCIWKWRGFALLVGWAPPKAPQPTRADGRRGMTSRFGAPE